MVNQHRNGFRDLTQVAREGPASTIMSGTPWISAMNQGEGETGPCRISGAKGSRSDVSSKGGHADIA